MSEYAQRFAQAQERAKVPGSVVLAAWNYERAAAKQTPKALDQTGLSFSDFAEWVKGGQTASSGVVTERTAMNISAVYACISLIGGALASIPLTMYRRGQDGTRERITPDEWWMLNEEFFSCWPAAAAWEYSTGSLLLLGDSFWRIHRRSKTSPVIAGFEPLHPATVQVRRINDRLRYKVSAQLSQTEGGLPSVDLDQDDMIHVPGPGFNGLRGLPQITSALRTSGSVAMSADEYMAAFFKNSARPDFVLTTDAANLSVGTVDSLRSQWEERYKGAAQSWKPAILTGGLKVQPITLTANDAQLLETRKFQVEDICRIFGVPPWMVGHTEKTTSWGSGVEQMSIAFVKYTLQRHLVKFEQEINRKIFRTAARFCEFNTAGLERGDMKSRNESYRIALGRAGEPAWMRPSEVRRLENLPPDPDLDELAEQQTAPAAPAAPAAPEPADPVEPAEPADPEDKPATASDMARLATAIAETPVVVNVSQPDIVINQGAITVQAAEPATYTLQANIAAKIDAPPEPKARKARATETTITKRDADGLIVTSRTKEI
jgi:HK97 family phage portal protein